MCGTFVLITATALTVLMVMIAFPEVTEAGTSYITGDWTVANETVRVVDSTIDVSGNITIGAGGILVLENATLIANSTVEGEGIFVEVGGILEAYNSTIEGRSGLTVFRSLGDVRLTDARVQRMGSMVLDDGYMSSTNSYIWCRPVIRTDIDIVNSSLNNPLLEYNHPSVQRNITWVLYKNHHRGLHFRISRLRPHHLP